MDSEWEVRLQIALQAGQELGLGTLDWAIVLGSGSVGEWTTVMLCDDLSADTCRSTEFGEACQQSRLWRQTRLRAWETGSQTRDEGWS